MNMSLFKDRLLLLLTGLICAVLAAMYWRFVGLANGVIIILLLTNTSLMAENRLLRRSLKPVSSTDFEMLARDPSQKIAAIRLYREMNPGIGLAQAKAKVEEIYKQNQ